MSYSLKSLKAGYIVDYAGECIIRVIKLDDTLPI